MEFYDIVINTHGVVSSIFTLIAIIILFRSISGWSFNKRYTKWDKKISILFLAFLYIQLILGILLYFVLGDHSGGPTNQEEVLHQSSLRFWALKHFAIMIFSLFLSQIGWIFISKTKIDLNKHKNTVFYFGSSIVLITIFTGIRLIWR